MGWHQLPEEIGSFKSAVMEIFIQEKLASWHPHRIATNRDSLRHPGPTLVEDFLEQLYTYQCVTPDFSAFVGGLSSAKYIPSNEISRRSQVITGLVSLFPGII